MHEGRENLPFAVVLAKILNGDGKTDVAFYFSGDGSWWTGTSDGSRLHWTLANESSGSGKLLDSFHNLYTGDFNGTTDVPFDFSGDGHWWTGLSGGNELTWHLAANIAGFGDLTR